jgi:acyl carrier protein
MKAQIEDFRKILSEVLEREIHSINITDTPKDIDGWDSLNHIYIIIKLENIYNVKFSTSQIQNWSCINDIISDINTLI